VRPTPNGVAPHRFSHVTFLCGIDLNRRAAHLKNPRDLPLALRALLPLQITGPSAMLRER
jgi:hypothetical protein